MCDEQMLARWARQGITRRNFGVGAIAAGAAACAPVESAAESKAAAERSGRQVTFATPAGTMDGEFFHPASGKHPGVIFWPDIAGIRPAKRQMAQRLADEGYAVLLANPYYRDVAGQQFEDFASFAGSGGFETVKPWRSKFTPATIQIDARACAEWLLEQAQVDTDRGIGAQGYCMTGSFAVVAPSADDRIQAGASFHGGGLVREGGASPHSMLRADARYLIAISQDDDAEEPDAKTSLEEAAAATGTKAEIAVYPADHGWCVPDAPAYNREQAERAWTRLLATYSEGL
ncbi:dienelactone hydrolase family protein [Qipengyuania qiaonensis]|uniref:Dienelactone hydrolase family protein n=1 Tax=Qipengyuania qiaonensis TaxID=2867240 RepID=A0ABS7J2N1_9SPHN|nr:dienelactone hydrolase family protein [Qipengyuania qiaonensis]MBX7481585.1 dienelactone hydrolase family protein [Qipengyuania qiaonensis]